MEKKTRRNKVLQGLRLEFNLAMMQIEVIFDKLKKNGIKNNK